MFWYFSGQSWTYGILSLTYCSLLSSNIIPPCIQHKILKIVCLFSLLGLYSFVVYILLLHMLQSSQYIITFCLNSQFSFKNLNNKKKYFHIFILFVTISRGKTHFSVSPTLSILYYNTTSLLTPDVCVFGEVVSHTKRFCTSQVSYDLTQC